LQVKEVAKIAKRKGEKSTAEIFTCLKKIVKKLKFRLHIKKLLLLQIN